MPLTTQATLSYEVQSITIDGTGACTVLLAVSLGSQRLQSVQTQLDAATCAPVWQGMPAPGMSRWVELRTKLYALLQAQGVIPA
jgi:hypothetical protein